MYSFKRALALVVSIGLLSNSFVLAEEAEKKKEKNWKNETEFSFVSTNGNSKAQTISGEDRFEYNWSNNVKLQAKAGGLGTGRWLSKFPGP